MKQALILLFFLPILSFGQSKFSFGVNAGAKAGILTLDAPSGLSVSQEAKPNIGYSFGMDVSYLLNKRYFLRSGFGYENSRFSFQTEGVVWGSCIEASAGIVRETNYYEVLSIKSIQIPIDFGYFISGDEKDLKIFLGAGVQYNHILKTETRSRIEKEGMASIEPPTGTSDDGIDASVISGKIFMGFEYPFYSKLSLIVEPTIKFTPNEFDLFFFREGKSLIEPGVVLRLNF